MMCPILFIYNTMMTYKKSVLKPSRVVVLAEHLYVYWRIGWDGVNKTSEKHPCCSESPCFSSNSSNMIFILKIALCCFHNENDLYRDKTRRKVGEAHGVTRRAADDE